MEEDRETRIDRAAQECVLAMGDVFWHFVPARDAPLGLVDPETIAVQEVRNTLWAFVTDLDRDALCSDLLRAEYRELTRSIVDQGDEAIITALIAKADWTLRGAVHVLGLAQGYGTSVLSNALALAEALGIEDGTYGL